jgi:transporter family-2 protein
MSKVIYLILALTSGFLFGIQASINGALGKRIGIYETALLSSLLTSTVLILITLIFGKGNILGALGVPKWQVIGGFLGAFILMTMTIAVPHIGVASTVFFVIVGQMIISIIIDNFGFFNVPVIPFNIYRFFGILFMIIAVLLIIKGNFNN